MLQPKLISKAGIPAALEKVTRYRLLNEPLEAESICRDVIAIEPTNQEAQINLLLAITDQFNDKLAGNFNEAQAVLANIEGEYDRAYYEGIINERWANAQLSREGRASIGWYRAAMRSYAKAEELSDPDNDDAVLRWNTCVRVMQRYDFAAEEVIHDIDAAYGDDMPLR